MSGEADRMDRIDVRPQTPQPKLTALLAIFSLQDSLLFVYLLAVWALVWRAGPIPAAEHAARGVYVCIATLVIGCACARTPRDVSNRFRWFIYRAALAAILLADYLMLRDILPLVRPDEVDSALLRIDYAIFHVEPALALERFSTPAVVEFFAFFYFSYFFLCATYLVAAVWMPQPPRRTAEFALGTILVFAIGQLGYMAVPAFGPVSYLATSFHGPLRGGFFWSCVLNTVHAGGAMKDVFPSLHTAVPTWFALFAAHQAKTSKRWRIGAIVTAVFAANIVVSTMLLRWHYAIDVVAGLALAIFAGVVAPRAVAREAKFRRANGFPEVFGEGGYEGNTAAVAERAAVPDT